MYSQSHIHPIKPVLNCYTLRGAKSEKREKEEEEEAKFKIKCYMHVCCAKLKTHVIIIAKEQYHQPAVYFTKNAIKMVKAKRKLYHILGDERMKQKQSISQKLWNKRFLLLLLLIQLGCLIRLCIVLYSARMHTTRIKRLFLYAFLFLMLAMGMFTIIIVASYLLQHCYTHPLYLCCCVCVCVHVCERERVHVYVCMLNQLGLFYHLKCMLMHTAISNG